MKRVGAILSSLSPRPRDILFLIVFWLVALYGSNLFRDGDPARHITIGTLILKDRTILTRDVFSYTMQGQLVTPHEWLAQVAFGASYLWLGLGGMVLLTALLIASTTSLVHREIERAGAPQRLAFGLALWVAAMTGAHWLARPHIFTLLLLALWTADLRRLSKGEPVAVWRLPLTMLIWANTHGAFIAGFVVWGAYVAGWIYDFWRKSEKPPGRILRNLLLAGGASFLVTFINPVGWRLWATSVGYVTNRYLVDLTSEYRSLDFHHPEAWPFLAFLVFTMLVLTGTPKKLPTAERCLLVTWAALALYSARNMPLFAVVATPVVAGCVQSKTATARRLAAPVSAITAYLRAGVWPLAVLSLATLAVSAGWKLDHTEQQYHFNKIDFPIDAVDWLEKHPQTGNMYNFFPWGGYLIQRLWPAQLVFIDGQLDFYGEQFTRRYQSLLKVQPGWDQVLEEYRIQWLLVPPDEPIALVLRNTPGWLVLYQDRTAVIMRRDRAIGIDLAGHSGRSSAAPPAK